MNIEFNAKNYFEEAKWNVERVLIGSSAENLLDVQIIVGCYEEKLEKVPEGLIAPQERLQCTRYGKQGGFSIMK